MGSEISVFRTKALQRAERANKYFLYRAALEWSLIDPIVIENRNDIKSESRWRNRGFDLYDHQVQNLITFCRRLPVTLLADDVGLGKTISAGLIISELISRGKISKILVVCPKILGAQWKEELDTKFQIPADVVTGTKLVGALPPEEVGAVITTYHSARAHLEDIAGSGFDMLILDEAHKLRNLYGVEHPPQVAINFRKALGDRMFKYVLMLTATPIQNRLWDIYSLIELLTVARGHENPFGNEGNFIRKYVKDKKAKVLQLKEEVRDEFRSIVYGYMSRVRRADAKLLFPERKIELHKVEPTPEEQDLFNVVYNFLRDSESAGKDKKSDNESVKKLNHFSKIGILQSLVSSPESLVERLKGMVKNKTVPESFYNDARMAAGRVTITAKLKGLGELIKELRKENPKKWRVVIFTKWLETQLTIQNYLEAQGISTEVINGSSGSKNQETLARFRHDPPEVNVIVSTEAGSEGVNLQAANVIVNYDLPWNPMIVEQRIGRVQRLASKHAYVSIFNVILKSTFDEYIVGRLMEKLEAASHAIGDIEALLEAADLEDDDGEVTSFEEKVLHLVMASLEGKNVEEDTRLAEKSILDAKLKLETEEKNINSLLGGMGDIQDTGPRLPSLPEHSRSFDSTTFVLTALKDLGAEVKKRPNGLYSSEFEGRTEIIRFDNTTENQEGSVLYGAGSRPFERLIDRILIKALHNVSDNDKDIESGAEKIAKEWLKNFSGQFNKFTLDKAWRYFSGRALLRVRATMAHDSYERLVDVQCSALDHRVELGRIGLHEVGGFIEEPRMIGIDADLLSKEALLDPGIEEFCRFYNQRLVQELEFVGNDERKKKKLQDDFTPRLDITLVGLEGEVSRELELTVTYGLGEGLNYSSILNVVPSQKEILSAPEMGVCEKTDREVPVDCLEKCEISQSLVLKHLLSMSELSGRLALPEFVVVCVMTGKRILSDEAEKSTVTGELVTRSLLKVSELSGKLAEPKYIRKCAFTSAEVLDSEAAKSEISGKYYRIDEELRSAVSGKTGHKQEFIFCAVTNQPLLLDEAEKCGVTGKLVVPGILEECAVSGKKVLPTELAKSAVSGKKALKKYFVSSSISNAPLLEDEASTSQTGKFCTPAESKACSWSGRKSHPDDLRVCDLTGLQIYFEFMTSGEPSRLEALVGLLDGIQRKADKSDIWDGILEAAKDSIRGDMRVESSELSPDGKNLAACLQVRTLFGLRVRYVGFIYSITRKVLVGHVVLGKRDQKRWTMV